MLKQRKVVIGVIQDESANLSASTIRALLNARGMLLWWGRLESIG